MTDRDSEELYTAGRPAPPGRYARIEPPDGRAVVLALGDRLPASLDGRVAVYRRLPLTPILRRPAAPGEPGDRSRR